MSYEGYNQLLCANGHLSGCDCYDFLGNDEVCSICGAAIVWSNSVDQTNGDEVGFIADSSWEKLLIKPAAVKACKHCGHVSILEPATYRIPTEEELLDFRTLYIDGELKTFREIGIDNK